MFEERKLFKIFIRRNEITPSNHTLLKNIKNIYPWVVIVIWSNLCDNFDRNNFVNMSKYVSNNDTMHTCHTMNWVSSVFGTEISDYFPAELRKKKYQSVEDL